MFSWRVFSLSIFTAVNLVAATNILLLGAACNVAHIAPGNAWNCIISVLENPGIWYFSVLKTLENGDKVCLQTLLWTKTLLWTLYSSGIYLAYVCNVVGDGFHVFMHSSDAETPTLDGFLTATRNGGCVISIRTCSSFD